MMASDYIVAVVFNPVAYDFGGVVTNSRRETENCNKNKRAGVLKEIHWLLDYKITINYIF